MKKLLSVLLAAVLLVTAMPLGAFEFEASAVTEGYYTYTVSNGKATITDVDQSIGGDVTIPSTLGGYTVTSIGSSAFRNCSVLTSVTIPDSVTSIGYNAFLGCSALTSVTIPDSVTSIGFSAFEYCRYLKSVTIGNSVTSIGERAFSDCSKLTSITIPNSVTSIGSNAFSSCSSLTSITVNENNAYYSSNDGVLFNKNKTELIRYPCGKTNTNYVIPDTVTSIGNSAFEYCRYLKSVTIGNSVTSIGDSAFHKCSSLTSVTVGNSVTSMDTLAFYECSSLTNVYITNLAAWCEIDFKSDSSNPLVYADNLYINGELAKNITIPDSVTNIGNYAFRCSSLTSVTIGNSVTSIGNQAFYYCSKLTNITIPDSVTSIGNGAFEYCRYLKSVTIGNSVTSIGGRAFYNCDRLTSITIPDSVTTIGRSAFYYCSKLTNVYYRGSLEAKSKISIGSYNDYLTMATWYYNSCIGSAEHQYGDDLVCDECGHKNFVLGDINGTGEVDLSDVNVISKYLAGWGVDCNQVALDVNYDYEVNLKDLVLLAQYVAGWDVQIY